jgi:hypothetical protein
MNSTGTRSRTTAALASMSPKTAAPDRLTAPATAGRILAAATSIAVPPIDEPTSTTLATPRRRSSATAATTSSSTWSWSWKSKTSTR